ncbi:uncharacterized protein LOC134273545 [Saccostrea cucullata]|uniref:uncharacterized protein LOC134273545 n=1 Tax=Saccostrea cuccullata TaxID=36930 RepID=UPI002ED5D23A
MTSSPWNFIFLHFWLTFIWTSNACNVDILNSLTDSAFSASTEKTSAANIKSSKPGYWTPSANDSNPYVQATFSTSHKFVSLTLNGSTNSYDVLSSFDGVIWDKQSSTASAFTLTPTLYGSYFRIVPTGCVGECTVKVDLQGCDCIADGSIQTGIVTYLEPSSLSENFVYLSRNSIQEVSFIVQSSGTDLSIVSYLDTNSTVTSSMTTTTEAKVTLDSSKFPSLGTYLLRTEVQPCKGTGRNKDLIVYHEEMIAGLDVKTAYGSYIPLGELAEFFVSLTSGTNVEMEWMIDHNITTCIEIHNGEVRNVVKTFEFTEMRMYNITVFARNGVTAKYKTINVMGIRRPSNFQVETTPGLYQTREQFNMTVSNNLTIDEVISMGNLYLEVLYGNGQNDTIYLNPYFQDITGFNKSTSGKTFLCQYLIQGNYTLSAKVRNNVGFEEFNFTFYAWDELNMTLNSSSLQTIGEPTVFTFLDPPNAGFRYTISYGDGNETNTNDTIYYSDYNVAPWTFGYTSPAVYTVIMTAWNPFHAVVQTYNITAQHPIPTLEMNPTGGDFPRDDGLAIFYITMTVNKPSPTNVTCRFDFEDKVFEEPTTFDYNKTVTKTYTYTFNGFFFFVFTPKTKTVIFECWNLVSSWRSEATVTIRDFDINDVVVNHPPEVGMNMTLRGNATELLPFGEIGSIPVVVTFRAQLYQMNYVPPRVRFIWKFGDEIDENSLLELDSPRFDCPHEYKDRGFYEGSLTVEYGSEKATIPFSIKMGVANFSANVYEGSPSKDTITFTTKDLLGTAVYEVDLIIAQRILTGTLGNPVSTSIIYPHRGQYLPKVIASNGTLTEILYLPYHVGIDYVFEGINMTVPSELELPPGHAVFIFGVPNGADPVLDIRCEFTSGDRIDKAIHSRTKNLTDGNPIIYNYQYLTLGFHLFNLHCKNFAHTYVNSTIILVQNECFSINGIFDRQYSNRTTPMIVLTSKDIDLASRMLVYCPERGPDYRWTFYNVTGQDEDVYEYTPVVKPTGSIRFAKGTVPAGLYKVSLNVTLDGTWMQEYTFVKFEKPKPYAHIVRGSKYIASVTSGEIELDALTESYDVQEGYGFNSELTFTWYCNTVPSPNIVHLDELYLSNGGRNYYMTYGPGLDSDCRSLFSEIYHSVSNSSNITSAGNTSETGGVFGAGKQTIPLTVPNVGYIITVAVAKDELTSYFTQLVQVVSTLPHDISVVCSINCLEKHAVTSPLSVTAVCNDCGPETLLKYEWRLQHYLNRTYEDIPSLINMTSTPITEASITLKANQLVPGEKYALSVNVTSNEKDPTLAVWDITVNYPPYNGTCYSMPKTGNASTSSFSVNCEEWRDEGIYPERSETRDPTLNEPLVYEYVAYIPETDGSSKYYSGAVPLFRGSESTATELPLPVGSETLNYKIEIEVRIYDRYGDFAVYHHPNTEVTVVPDSSLVPADLQDTGSLDSLFGVFDRNYTITEAGGNSMAVVRLVQSTASIYLSAHLEPNGTVTSTSDLFSGVVGQSQVVEDVPIEPAQEKLMQRTRQFTEILLNATSQTPATSDSPMSAANARQVARSLASCVSNPMIVDDVSVETAAEGTRVLMDNIRQVSFNNPFPVEEIQNIQDTASGVLEALSNLVDIMVPNEISDPEKEPTLTDVLSDISDAEYYNDGNTNLANMTAEEKNSLAESVLNLKKKHREQQQKKSPTARNAGAKMSSAIQNSLKAKSRIVQVGTGTDTITTDQLQMSVQKDKREDLISKTLQRRDTGLELDSEVLNNSQAKAVEVWMTEYRKNPYFFASGSDKIRSSLVSIQTRDETEQEIDIPKNIKFQNNGTVYAKSFFFTNISEGEDPMFYFITNLDGPDAAIVYVKPDAYDQSGLGDQILYTAFGRMDEHPESNLYDYKTDIKGSNWEEPFGFKIFLPDKIFRKGKLYIGLKPKKVIDESQNTRRRKRAAVNTTSPSFNPTEANFSIALATSGCRTYDEATSLWVDNGCKVLDISTFNETICRCSDPPGTMFATTFYVPPNKIDFHAVWGKFDPENAAVYGTIAALLVIYFIALLYLRRKDKQDVTKWGTRFLVDSENSDAYFYLITVQTGLRRDGGTKSNVNFIIGGEDGDSGVRILSDGYTQGFQTGSLRTFLMGTKFCLGDLTYFRVWHDNSGIGNEKSWYLDKILVDDLQNGKRYVFLCDKWLAVEQDDGMVERILPLTSNQTLTSYDQLISEHARFNATENHLWLSMIIRPQRSNFTRVQRLTCAFALLFLTMITSCMFFKTDDEVRPNQVSIGIIKFSLTTFYISFISILIATVPIFIVTFIFKKSRAKDTVTNLKKEEDKKEKSPDDEYYNEEEDTVNFFKDEKLPLPHGMVYVGWTILILAILTSAFFVILYSMEFGKTKSEEWLSTFVFAFFESLFVLDPINVIVMAILVAILFRKPVDGKCPNVDLDVIKTAAEQKQQNSSRIYLTFRNEVLCSNGPPDETLLDSQRKLRQNEVAAQAVFRRLVVYAVFVFIVFSIGYINRDARSYNLRRSIDSQIYHTTKGTYGFESITSARTFIEWLRHTLLPRLFPTSDIRGQSISVLDKQFFSDFSQVRVGPALLRQNRMKESSCNFVVDSHHRCVNEYDIQNEDVDNYCLGWKLTNGSCGSSLTDRAWKYTSSGEVWGMPFEGLRNTYGGGGYMIQFEKDIVASHDIINELEQNLWIDRRTRSVFLEFTLYNPNVNLFFNGIYLVEFPESAGVVTWVNLQVFRPFQALGAIGTYALLCYFIYVIFLLISTGRMMFQIWKKRCNFFKDTWNIVDLVSTFLGVIAIAFWAVRYVYANKALDKYYDNKLDFIQFQHIAFWDNAFVVVIGILIFIATIRILQILGYNRRMTQLIAVISGASKDLSGFAIVFGIIYFAYVVAGYLLFGKISSSYRSLFVSFGSLLNSIIGKNHLDILRGAGVALGEVYYFTYILIVILVLISMFAVILNISITVVKQEIQDGESIYGLTNVVSDSVKNIVGMFMNIGGKKKSTASEGIEPVRKYELLQSRKPDFDPPNIVNLLQDIFLQYGKDGFNTMEKIPEPYERPVTQTELTIQLDENNDENNDDHNEDISKNPMEDEDLTIDDRYTKKVQEFSGYL